MSDTQHQTSGHPASADAATRAALRKVGFMQGRLSPLVDGRIQAFPREHWEAEFAAGASLGFGLLEWTLDQDGLRENPLLTDVGRRRIGELCAQHKLYIRSVTGDCFMQAPFYKSGNDSMALLNDLRDIIARSAAVGVAYIVLPLVDAGRLENPSQAEALVTGLRSVEPLLSQHGVRIVFESDYGPQELASFIEGFPDEYYGINYDIGNSSALGFDAREEIRCYGSRILNVHVKDRPKDGTTVPLGQGAARFDDVFASLAEADYAGNFILQTARAADGEHAKVLATYRDMTLNWMRVHGFA